MICRSAVKASLNLSEGVVGDGGFEEEEVQIYWRTSYTMVMMMVVMMVIVVMIAMTLIILKNKVTVMIVMVMIISWFEENEVQIYWIKTILILLATMVKV